MSRLVARFLTNRYGATAIEYGLIAGLIAFGLVVGAGALGNAIDDEFTHIGNLLNESVK